MHSGEYDGFGLVSSDSDFTGLAQRLRQAGKPVYGFGEAKSIPSFRKACTVFTVIGPQEASPETAPMPAPQPLAPPDPVKVKEVVTAALDFTKEPDGWSNLANVGLYMRMRDGALTVAKCGFKSMAKLIESYGDAFELQGREAKQGKPKVVYARVRANEAAPKGGKKR